MMMALGAVLWSERKDCHMFTGRITEVGTVADAGSGLVIEAPKTAGSLSVGASVNVNGACLSAEEVGGSWFRVEVSPETVNRSTLAGMSAGGRVNLECPLRVGTGWTAIWSRGMSMRWAR